MKREKFNMGNVLGMKRWEISWAAEGTSWLRQRLVRLLKAISIQSSYHLHGFHPKDRKHSVISVYSFQLNLPLGRLNFPLLPSEVIVYCLVYCNIPLWGNKRQGASVPTSIVSRDFSPNLFLFLIRATLAEPSLAGLHHIWKIRHLKLCQVLLHSS